MKKNFSILFFCLNIFVFGQVTIEKNRLVKEGSKYPFSKYESVFTNSEAKETFKKAKNNASVGQIFGFAGGLSMGFGIGQLILGPKKEFSYNITTGTSSSKKVGKAKGWGMLGIGAGLVGIGIPFAISAEKNAKKALALENGETTAFKPHFKIENSENGIAFSYHF